VQVLSPRPGNPAEISAGFLVSTPSSPIPLSQFCERRHERCALVGLGLVPDGVQLRERELLGTDAPGLAGRLDGLEPAGELRVGPLERLLSGESEVAREIDERKQQIAELLRLTRAGLLREQLVDLLVDLLHHAADVRPLETDPSRA